MRFGSPAMSNSVRRPRVTRWMNLSSHVICGRNRGIHAMAPILTASGVSRPIPGGYPPSLKPAVRSLASAPERSTKPPEPWRIRLMNTTTTRSLAALAAAGALVVGGAAAANATSGDDLDTARGDVEQLVQTAAEDGTLTAEELKQLVLTAADDGTVTVEA